MNHKLQYTKFINGPGEASTNQRPQMVLRDQAEPPKASLK